MFIFAAVLASTSLVVIAAPANALTGANLSNVPENINISASNAYIGDTSLPKILYSAKNFAGDYPTRPYIAHLYDIDTGKIVAFSELTSSTTLSFTLNKSFIDTGVHKYQIVIGKVSSVYQYSPPANLSDLNNVVGKSKVLDFERKPFVISLDAAKSTFEQMYGPKLTLTTYQYYNTAEYKNFLVDITTGRVVTYTNSLTANTIDSAFPLGSPHQYQAFIAKTYKVGSTTVIPTNLNEIQGIIASSNIVSVAREPWKIELVRNYASADYAMDIRTTKTGGGKYTFYVADDSTGEIFWNDSDKVKYPQGKNLIPNTRQVNDTSWATAYLAKPYQFTDSSLNTPEPTNISQLTDIQATSKNYSKQTSGSITEPAEIAGGSNPSEPCSQSCEGDPVNMATGEFFENSLDLETVGSGLTPNVSRSFSTLNKDRLGILGYGWRNNFEMSLKSGTNEPDLNITPQIKIEQENGSISTFFKTPSGEYEAPSKTQATLERDPITGNFKFVRNLNTTFIFSGQGQLTSVQNTDGHKITLSYNSSNTLNGITDLRGNAITFTYSNGLISTAIDQNGRTVQYFYDANKNLNKIIDAGNTVKEYTYDTSRRVSTLKNELGGVTTNTYDTSHRVIKQIDPLNNTLLFSYTGNLAEGTTRITYPNNLIVDEKYMSGQLVSRTENPGQPDVRTWKYSYDGNNNLISTINPDGTNQTALYNPNGNIIKSIDSKGLSHSFTYDAKNNLLTSTNPLGEITTNTYNLSNKLISTTNANGEKITFTYNTDGLVISATDARGNASGANPADYTSTFTYTSQGLLDTTTNAMGNKVKNVYNSRGHLIKSISPRGNEPNVNSDDFATQYSYNNLDLVSSIIDPLLNETAITYDAMGNVLTSQDPLANVSSYTYDQLGNILTKTNALQETTSYHYDAMNRVDSITGPTLKTSFIIYDKFGRVIETKDALGRSTKQEWNITNQLTASIDASGSRTEYTYDLNGNLVKTKSPVGQVSLFTYDSLNRMLSSIDPEGKETKNEYDVLGRTVKTIYPDSTFTYSTYDAVGNVVSTTNQAGKVRSWEYDDLGRKTKYIDETLREESYAYDAASNLISKTRADNSVVSYVYDTRNLLTTVDYPGTDSDISYLYDALGRKISEQKGAEVATTYAYDAIGQLTSRGPPSSKVSYEYDALGNNTKLTYPSGRVVNYAYDDASQLINLTNTTLGTVNYGYDNRGNSTSTTLPNQVIESSTYDANNRLTGVSIANGSNVIYKKTHAYSAVGNIVQQDKTGTGITTPTLEDFSYDPLSRLTSQTKNADGSPVNSYAYDSVGNLTTINSVSQSFDDSGKILSSGTKTFTYDTRNNRVSTTSGTPAVVEKNYEWAFDNLLTEVEKPADTKTVNYSYDVSGLLGTRSENTVQTNNFVWDITASIPLMLSDGEYEYIYGTGRTPLAQISLTDGSVKYLHTDVNGSITASTDTTGTLIGSVVYSPYGTTIDVPVSNFGFAGEWTDKTTGYSYLRARWLDTSTGTFLSEDPLTQSTGQAFGYTAGNPLQQIDPLGLCNVFTGDLVNIGSSCYSFADTPAFQNISDASAGFGDNLSFGGTNVVREIFGLNSAVNTCSTSYSVGDWAGTAIGFITPGGIAKVGVKSSFKATAKQSVNSRPTLTAGVHSTSANPIAVPTPPIKQLYSHKAKLHGPHPQWTNDEVLVDKLFKNRPKFRNGTLQKVYDEAKKDANGQLICPTCGVSMDWKPGQNRLGIMDVDHYNSSWQDRLDEMMLRSYPPTRKEVSNSFQVDTRGECFSCNRSRGRG